MKKYFIVGALVVSMIVPIFVGAQGVEDLQKMISALLQQVAQLQLQIKNMQGGDPKEWCHDFNTNLGVGSRGSEVSALHHVLIEKGFNISDREQPQKDGEGDLGHVFDESTAAAVTGFQQKYKDEILTPSGLAYGTGYVGPATRRKLNQLYGCGVDASPIPFPTVRPTPFTTAKPRPSPTSQDLLKVISPNGGESWLRGSSQTIKWSDGTIYPPCPADGYCSSQIPKSFDVKLVSYYPPCTENICPAMPHMAPYTIAKNVFGYSYNWFVGQVVTDLTMQIDGTSNNVVPDGSYKIQVCYFGTGVCDLSDTYFKVLSSFIYPTFTPKPTSTIALPNPKVILIGKENLTGSDGVLYTRYNLKTTNWEQYSDDLFVLTKDLPPCGINDNASRTWVNIYNANIGARIYGFCGFYSKQGLSSLWFAVPQGTLAPSGIYIEILDRKTNTNVRSNTVSI